MPPLPHLLGEIRACTLCAAHLPLGPRPVLRASETARLLIIGQAPGTRVHETGIPWNDRSGDRLRDWMGVAREAFYDEARVAIMPTGFCYPGRAPGGGDLPPRGECAPLWHPPLLDAMPHIRVTLLAGSYAQAFTLGRQGRHRTMTETVAAWRDYAARGVFPLPHPSWRTTAWARKNPWFEAELVPAMRLAVRDVLGHACAISAAALP